MIRCIHLPLANMPLAHLRSGDQVEVTGTIYGMRDAAHKRLMEAVQQGESPPIDLNGQVIYYVGPAPAKEGHVIGPAGPTTSGRMDPYTPQMLDLGVKGFIGKGYRSPEVKAALMAHGAVYFAAIGGAAALLAKTIVEKEVVAYADLGPEAIYRFKVHRFPTIVVHDLHGGDAYQMA